MSIKIKQVIDNLSESPNVHEYAVAIVQIEMYNNEVMELAAEWAKFYPLMADKVGGSS